MHQMTEKEFDALAAAVYAVLPRRMDTPASRAELWAIGRQESRMIHRRQLPLRAGMPHGPARGLWQFEKGGGVKGVMTHEASQGMARECCDHWGVLPTITAAYNALEHNDALAFAFARLLLWTDPKPLPVPIVANADKAWAYYLRTWRPGKPHRATWDPFWREGLEIIR